MDVKPIVGTAIGLGAASLLLHSTKMLPKVKYTKKKGFKMKAPSTKKMLQVGTGVLVGGVLLDTAAKAFK
jgi:hypothetical protein